jgi:hypothetical protein
LTTRIIVPDQSVPLPQAEEDYVPPERKGVTVALDNLEREVAADDEVNEAPRASTCKI